jgi:hypothetical protein
MPILARSPGPLERQKFRMTRGIAIPLLAVFGLRDRLALSIHDDRPHGHIPGGPGGGGQLQGLTHPMLMLEVFRFQERAIDLAAFASSVSRGDQLWCFQPLTDSQHRSRPATSQL